MCGYICTTHVPLFTTTQVHVYRHCRVVPMFMFTTFDRRLHFYLSKNGFVVLWSVNGKKEAHEHRFIAYLK